MQNNQTPRDWFRCHRAFNAAATCAAHHHYSTRERPRADVTQLQLHHFGAHLAISLPPPSRCHEEGLLYLL